MATGTKLMREISDQFLVCKICLEPFKEPKTLSCLHTFCLGCLQQQHETDNSRPSRYALYARGLTCPLCRKKTELPTGGVRRLPDNFLVSNLTEVLARRCNSKVPPCEICQTVQRARVNEACSKCLDCHKLLCRACLELHAATKVTQGHGLIDIEGQKDIECKEHPEETVRFYCERCEACICVVCTFQEHKDHDVCSFSEGFAKHKVALELLLEQSRARLTAVATRLKVIDKYQTVSKELKDRIRDLAISYTAQVRAREKELIGRVEELCGGPEGLGQLTDSKQWLQEVFDNLHSACNLTEIVMKDKGVEMLLLKKEIEGKLTSLLQGPLPPAPSHLHQQLDIRFVPGEVRLGEVLLPGQLQDEVGELKNIGKDLNGSDTCSTNGELNAEPKSSPAWTSKDPMQNLSHCTPSPCWQCTECAERKRRGSSGDKHGDGDWRGEKQRRVVTRSVYIQTKTQEVPPSGAGAGEEDEEVADGGSITPGKRGRQGRNGYFTSTAAQVTLPHSHDVTVASRAMQTTSVSVSTRSAATEATGDSIKGPAGCGREAENWAGRQRRTLKIQTEESCLRDAHLQQVTAVGGSCYPHTGAAIAAAFLRHSRDLEDKQARGTDSQTTAGYTSGHCGVEVAMETRDVQIATEVALGLTTSVSDILAALCPGSVPGAASATPDLLSQTLATSSSSAAAWIHSRKVQTEITALLQEKASSAFNNKSGPRFVRDEEFKTTLFGDASIISSPSVTAVPDVSTLTPRERARAARAAARAAAASKNDIGVMTSFNVRIVPLSTDKHTSPETLTSRDVELMTSPETRTLYIQTRGPRLTSTGMGTDREGQMSKSTSTFCVATLDAETAMPRVTQETRVTWTEAVMTSERATVTDVQKTTDAATLTAVRRTGDFGVQMRPQGVAACTNTLPPPRTSQLCQTTPPGTASKSTMPDPACLTPQLSVDDSTSTSNTPPSSSASSSINPSPAHSPKSAHRLSLTSLTVPSALALPLPVGGASSRASSPASLSEVGRVDKATETPLATPRTSSKAVGPSVQMQMGKTVGTDTLHLTQMWDRETCTPQVKTVDDWTHTPMPQMINTGVTPPRPATMEVGVATNPQTLLDQATYTEVVTLRESASETCTVVCDSETLTEKTLLCDAQTEAQPQAEDRGTDMGKVEVQEEWSMTEGGEGEAVMRVDHACQSAALALVNRDCNTVRARRKAREVQTPFSYLQCRMCQHPEQHQEDKAAGLGSKTFTDMCTEPNPRDTQDVGTMALSGLPAHGGLIDSGVQTSEASLYDKGVVTSFEWEDDFVLPPRSFLGLECQDAATSTESLPYIGLLSEIDVDELIVIPEANFELVSSDYDSDVEPIPMMDSETWTGEMDLAEQGTQTVLSPDSTGSWELLSQTSQDLLEAMREVSCKQLISIGVNTLPKMTFEKETSTPIRHLFSKGTMTFYVAKMDKATSTISNTRTAADYGTMGGIGAGRLGREARPHSKDSKVTMTSRRERRDAGVETDVTPLDGRITQCISKLRNVSERLNSPTLRKHSEGEIFFGQSFFGPSGCDPSAATPQPMNRPPGFPKLATGEAVMNLIRSSPTPRDRTAEEEQRQRQLHSLLVETDAVLRPKDPSPVRKAQPITTLKPRAPPAGNEENTSLLRQRSLERQKKVKMGSGQPSTPTSLSLLRYDPTPQEDPINCLTSTPSLSAELTSATCIGPGDQTPPTADMGSRALAASSSDYGAESLQRVPQRPILPSISETRTPSSCSESSFPSLDSHDTSSSNLPITSLASSHSRTPSNMSASDITSADVTKAESDAVYDDTSSVSSASTTLSVTLLGTPGEGATATKHKKEKKGFMKRLLSVKKKKEGSEKDKVKEDAVKLEAKAAVQQQPSRPPPSPKVQSKIQQTAKPKSQKPVAAVNQASCPSAVQPSVLAGVQPKVAPAVKTNVPAYSSASAQPIVPTPASASVPKAAPAKVPASTVATASALSLPASAADSKPPPQPSKGPAISTGCRPTSTSADVPPGPGSACLATLDVSPPMAPHHYPPLPDPSQAPKAPPKPRPFVYVRQRLMPIQQDNVEEVNEKKDKEKSEKEKGKNVDDEDVNETASRKHQNGDIQNQASIDRSEAVDVVKDQGQLKMEDPNVVGAEVNVGKGTPEARVASSRREGLAAANRLKAASVSREKLATVSGEAPRPASRGAKGKQAVDKVEAGRVAKVEAGRVAKVEAGRVASKPAQKVEKPKTDRVTKIKEVKEYQKGGKSRSVDWTFGK